MPYVNIKLTGEPVSRDKKALLVAGVTRLLKDVLGKDPLKTFVLIDEIDVDNWGTEGELVGDRLRKGQ
ncbi:MAG: 4-oxalocrotonate tautomerase family protein [Lysobacter sp.]|nr:4-oxalocrotonate tautomerase family protein [Lysobacter sp.]